jgi:hypothetical protein
MLGHTDRRAELGIHRTHAGRRGRLGRDQRAEVHCSTTTSPIDSANSSTATGRVVAATRPGGAARRVPLQCRAGQRTHRHSTGPRSGPGAVPRPHLLPAGWGTRLCHCPRPPQRAGSVPHGPLPVRGPAGQLTVAAPCGAPGLPLGPSGGRLAGLHRHSGAEPAARTQAVGGSAGVVASWRGRRGCPSLPEPRWEFLTDWDVTGPAVGS